MFNLSIREMAKLKNPDKSKMVFIQEMIKGKELGGVSAVLEPHREAHHHYHKNHECVFFVLSGEAIEKVEGKEYTLTKDTIMYIAAGEKHQMINRSDKEFHYFEIQIPKPDMSDAFPVES
jgi:quercetin dioxygenase-like cupin family protein